MSDALSNTIMPQPQQDDPQQPVPPLQTPSQGPVAAPPAPTANPSSIDLIINHAAQQYNLDPTLFRRQLIAESRLDPKAINTRSGAAGIAQLMPKTAAAMGVDPMDPQQAIPAAALFMRNMLNAHGGDYNKALAAYNWGPGNLARFGMNAAPQETLAYIQKITGNQPLQASPPTPMAVQPGPDISAPPPAQAQAQAQARAPRPPPMPAGAGPLNAPRTLADAFSQAGRFAQQPPQTG